jgi:hypothetical protein
MTPVVQVTYGLMAAHAAGNTKALPLIRGQITWFNYNEYLPEFLPPDGGPNADGYVAPPPPLTTPHSRTPTHHHHL